MTGEQASNILRDALPDDARFSVEDVFIFTRFSDGQRERRREARVFVHLPPFIKSVSAPRMDLAVETAVAQYGDFQKEREQMRREPPPKPGPKVRGPGMPRKVRGQMPYWVKSESATNDVT